MEKLIKQIHEEIDKNKNYQIDFENELSLFQHFFEEYSRTDMTSICNINLDSLLALILFASNINMSYNELSKKISTINRMIEITDDLRLVDIYIALIAKFIQDGMLDEAMRYVKRYGSLKYANKLDQINGIEQDIELFIRLSMQFFSIRYGFFVTDVKINIEEIKKVINIFEAVGSKEPFDQFTTIIFARKAFFENGDIRFIESAKKKDRNRTWRWLIKQLDPLVYESLIKSLDQISNHYNKLITKKNNEEKIASKTVKRNEQLLAFLNKIDYNNSITLNEKLLNLCTTPEIKTSLLAFINKHNLKIYKQVLETNQQYKNGSLNQLELLFTKNNFKFTRLSIEAQDVLIANGNLEQISKILEFLSKNNFGFIKETHPIFIDLLLYSNIDILNNINNLVNNDIITNEFIQKHPTILISECLKNELSYEKFMEKILFLRNENINIRDVVNSNPETFEYSLVEIQIQLEIIKKYDLNLLDGNFEILTDSSLLDLVDNYVELGLGDYIKESQQLISTNKRSLIERIIISRKLGISIFNESHHIISKVANANKFYIPEDKLKNFIINYSANYIDLKYKDVLDSSQRNVISNDYSELLEVLKQFENDGLTYKFGNTLISKNRLLRNLEAILINEKLREEEFVTILFQAIIYKSLIVSDENEITNIYNILTSLPKINLSSKVKQIHE